MTIKNRFKHCFTCKNIFYESKSDSNAQWEKREYCCVKCNSKSPKRVTSIFDRLERYQIIKNGCWGWSGNKDGNGYGMLSNRKGSGYSPEKAHRVSYEKSFGKIQDGFYICHKCDNPECTNPDHLFAGTQKDNMKDCSSKKRINKKSFLNLRPGAKGVRGAGLYSNKEIQNAKRK